MDRRVPVPRLTFRRATERDRATVARLVAELRRSLGARGPHTLSDEAWRVLAHQRRRTMLLAVRAGHPVGMIVIRESYSALRGKPFYFIGDLVVLPGARGTGVARSLLAEVRRRAVARGCDRVNLVVDSTRIEVLRLVSHAGFTKLGDLYLTLPL